jgi:dihydropteroate synthase
MAEVAEFLCERMQTATTAGIAKSQIILDPGIGFGKLLVHNLTLINELRVLTALDRPVLVGVSRKAFVGTIVDRDVADREWGTAAAVAIAVDRGAGIVRVHDVGIMSDVVKMASAIRSAHQQERYA